MQIFDKLKNYITKSKDIEIDTVEKEALLKADYDYIYNILTDYENNLKGIKQEEENLNGHKHFLRVETEEKVLNLIKENPEVLKCKDDIYGETLAMLAVKCEFKQVVSFAIEQKEYLYETDNKGRNLAMYCTGTLGNGSAESWEPMEDILIELLDDEKLRTAQEIRHNYNAGMLAAKNKLHNAVMRALDFEDCSIQQNTGGNNIGMFAAKYEDEEAVLKALDNVTARRQKNRICGENIGMLAARYDMEKATLKALDDEIASTQQDDNGYNIGMHAADIFMESAVIKALDNKVASLQINTDGNNMGIIAARRIMPKATLKALENPEASTYQNNYGRNIGMEAARTESLSMEEVVLKALDNVTARRQQTKKGYNIGMICAELDCFHKAILKSLDDEVVVTQTNNMGYNIGILSAINGSENGAEEVVLKALDNPVASTQLDTYGRNIGMIIAARKDNIWEPAISKALDNKQACLQQDDYGCTMSMEVAKYRNNLDLINKAIQFPEVITKQNNDGLTVGMLLAWKNCFEPVKTILQDKVARNQVDSDGLTICDYAMLEEHNELFGGLWFDNFIEEQAQEIVDLTNELNAVDGIELNNNSDNVVTFKNKDSEDCMEAI